MSLVISTFGIILLVASIALVVFGVIMTTNRKTRDTGKYFAIWWIPGAAAASGIVARDGVTFIVGGVCFLVAGAIFLYENQRTKAENLRRNSARRNRRHSDRTTAENPRRGYGRRAS